MAIGHSIFDIAEIFKALYGYTPPRVGPLPQATFDNPFSESQTYTKKTQTIKGSPLYGLSDEIGREVFCPVSIKAGSKQYDFPYAILGFKSKMIYKETPLIERGGSVIEEIGVGPWQISCKGFLIDPQNQFPDEALDALNQLYKYQQPVNLICALSDLFLTKNDQVVIIDLDVPAKGKVMGVKEFSFTMIEDTILDLTTIR